MAAGHGDADTRRAALDALPRVARTGTHLFAFARYVEEFRGWGRSLRRAVGAWYAAQPVGRRSPTRRSSTASARASSHRDLLRLRAPGAAGVRGQPDPRR